MIIEDWNDELGLAQCVITDNNNNITLEGFGMAQCHDEDKEFKSQVTGQYIALNRAQIDILRKKRDFDLKPGLMALKHLKATMTHSSKYNPKSYEARRLNKEIQNIEKEIRSLNIYIQDEKAGLKKYLNLKEKIYHKAEIN